MKKLNYYLKHTNELKCPDYILVRDFKDIDKETRLVMNMAKRGGIKPWGVYNPDTDKIYQIGNDLYAVNRKLILRLTVKTTPSNRRSRLIQERTAEAHKIIKNFFARRVIDKLLMDSGYTGLITTKDSVGSTGSKYRRKTNLYLPLTFATHCKWSTDDFLVLNKERKEDIVDDMRVCKVTGWWKTDIKSDMKTFNAFHETSREADHKPVEAWLAYCQGTHTITNSKETALRGLKIRLTNKIFKSIAA